MFSIEFTYSPAFLVLCAALAGGLTWWMYRKPKVQMHRAWLTSLVVCRSVALFILAVLLLEPLFTSVTELKSPPIVTLLVDNSESLMASPDSVFVKQKLKAEIKQLTKQLEDKGIRVQTRAVGTQLNELGAVDSLTFAEAGSNLSKGLDQLADRMADQNLGAVVLISDGIYTQGANPIHHLDRFQVPVHTVMVGDSTPAKDLLIENLQHNELTYLNTETPIRVGIKSQGFGQIATNVDLIWRGKVLQSKAVNLIGNPAVQQVEFRVRASEPGLQRYTIRIANQPGELNYDNNVRYLYIKVLENRLKIGILAGGPHPDLGAIEQSLGKDPRFQLTFFTKKTANDYYTNPGEKELGQQDLFIFHNYPTAPQDRAILDRVYQRVEAKKTPLLHFVGTATRFNIHPDQAKHMALFPTQQRLGATEAFLYLTPEYKNHASWRFEDEKAFQEWLETAPPLLRNDSEWQPTAGAKVYGKAKIKGIALNYPILGIQENNTGKNITWIGENFWRFRVHNFVENQHFTEFDNWMYNLLQWLSTREDNRRFRVFPAKNQFDGKETVLIKGQVYDESYQPISGAEIRLTLTDPDGKKSDYFLRQEQPGSYQLSLSNLAPGAYNYQATGIRNGARLGSDAGQFSVGKSAIEFEDLTARPDVLRQVALRSKGTFVSAKDMNQKLLPEILKQENMKPLVEFQRSTLGMNRFWWPMLIVLGLLAVEWVIRKRNGMI